MDTKASVRYILTKPSKSRKRFALVAYTLLDRQTKRYKDLDPALRASVDSINTQFLLGTITVKDAEIIFKELIQEEYRKAGVRSQVLKQSAISKVNQKLLNSYWVKEYSDRFLVDEKSPRHKLEKAFRLIDPVSLATGTTAEILAKLKETTKSRTEMRGMIAVLNQVMNFLGKKRIPKPPPEVKKIDHVTLPEFERVLPHLSEGHRDLAATLFAGGLRLSEAMALTEQDLINGRLNIDKQLRPQGLKLPKEEKTGRTLLIHGFEDYVARWLRVENKEQYRGTIYNALQRACKVAKVKVVGPHDLRHSHAIHLLSKGATLKQVAFNLRNTTDVCEKYYTGFVHTDETLESLNRTLSSK